MKKLMLISLLFLSGCSFTHDKLHSKFKVGDCFAMQRIAERWEKDLPSMTYKVLEVGKRKYRIARKYTDIDKIYEGDEYISFDRINEKVECPTELENYK